MLLEIFSGEYRVPLKNVRVVFDIGANLGYASWYFWLRYPKATIYAFEADPATFAKLWRNTRWLKRIVPIHTAVTDQDGSITFYSSPVAISSSTVERPGSRKITVPSASFNTIKAKYGTPDLVKYDIEGGEFDMIAAADLSGVRHCIGEYHEDLAGKPVAEFCALFPNAIVKPLQPMRYTCSSALAP